MFSKEDGIFLFQRSKEDALSGTSFNGSIKKYLEHHSYENPKNIVVLTLDYPFSRHNYIDTAIYSMFLFGSSSIDSVIMDNSIFYYHDGSGLKPWVETYIRRERDDIYIRRGGISVFRSELLISQKDIISKKMGHVIVDKLSSFEIRSSEDRDFANFIAGKLMNGS